MTLAHLCLRPESHGSILLVSHIKSRPMGTNFNSPLMVGENGPGFGDYQLLGHFLWRPGQLLASPLDVYKVRWEEIEWLACLLTWNVCCQERAQSAAITGK